MAVIEQETVYTEAPVITKRDVLHRAADLLEEFGHVKNDIGSKERPGFCAIGAVIEAERDLGVGPGLVQFAPGFPTWDKLVNWNNKQETTGAEVVAVFREAAEAA